MDRPVPPLSYDSAARRPHRWLGRGLIFGALAIALAFGSVWVGPLWNQSKILYWQNRCATHKPSGQQFPREWTEYNQLVSPPGVRSQGVLFLGQLVSPNGQRRVVAVDGAMRMGYSGTSKIRTPNAPSDLSFNILVVAPATWPLNPPRLSSTIVNLSLATTDVLCFDAGQVDPGDPSHFSIPTGPGLAVIDGWLGNNGKVRLEVRKQ